MTANRSPIFDADGKPLKVGDRVKHGRLSALITELEGFSVKGTYDNGSSFETWASSETNRAPYLALIESPSPTTKGPALAAPDRSSE